jgi:hypothetical protein
MTAYIKGMLATSHHVAFDTRSQARYEDWDGVLQCSIHPALRAKVPQSLRDLLCSIYQSG